MRGSTTSTRTVEFGKVIKKQRNLLAESQRIYVAVGDVPVEKPVGIFGASSCQKGEDYECGTGTQMPYSTSP